MALRTSTFALLALFTGACAGAKPAPVSGVERETEHPLSAFASERIIVLPTQVLSMGDAMGWGASIPAPAGFLMAADSALEREAGARRLSSTWIFPTELIRSAKRNPTYATDPNAIRASEAVRRLERNSRGQLAEPVQSQLRVLAGLHDARYALVPVELRFEPTADGKGRAVMHLALVDIRGSRLEWSGDVASDAGSAPTTALLAGLAMRMADLIVAR